MNNLTLIFKLSTAIGLFTLSSTVWAGCSGGAAQSTSFAFPNISIPRDKAVGSTINSTISVGNTSSVNISCSSGTARALLKFGAALTPVTGAGIPAGVFETNVPGIGVRVQDTFSGTVTLGNTIQNWYSPGSNWSGSAWLTGIKVQLYVIGSVSPGELTFEKNFIESWMNTAISTSGAVRYGIINVSNKAKVEVLACETPDITVDLKKHESSEFTSVSSTSTETKFNFEVNNCDPGLNSVNYTFKPATGINLEGSAANQYLTLDSGSTASGVGIQVLYENGNLVPFNTKIAYTGYVKTTGGSYAIPMRARYIKTSNNIVGGSANSALEFTMTYE